MSELFKPTISYPKIFSVSNRGNVKSIRTGRILKQTKLKNGYYTISTYLNGRGSKAICVRVHRLIAEVFCENHENKKEVHHIDGDKSNNRADNLQWVTHDENIQAAYDDGLVKIPRGKDRPNSKLTEKDVLFIRQFYKSRDKKYSITKLADMFNVGKTTIKSAVHKRTWKHI